MEDIVIIGAGPAGLTAAIYVQRAGRHAVVYEGKAYGGQIVYANNVENYPAIKNISGVDYATNLYEQAIALGAEVRFEKITGIKLNRNIKILQTPSGEIKANALIIATGASNRPLGVNDEGKFLGKGVSYCATCDGAFFKDKDVAVVGGGNTALEDAIYLSKICKKVYLIHRRNEFRGEAKYVKELKKKKNVEFLLENNVTKLLGSDVLEGVELTNSANEKQNLNVSALFVAVGQVPGNSAFQNVITLDNFGYVVATENCHTNVPGIYVAGDARTKFVRQLTTACADGATAAIYACSETKTRKM